MKARLTAPTSPEKQRAFFLILKKPNATFSERLKVKELQETLDYKNIDDAIEALRQLD